MLVKRGEGRRTVIGADRVDHLLVLVERLLQADVGRAGLMLAERG